MNSSKPTILQILPALNQGGVERGTVQIDNALVAAGWNSIVVSSGGRMVEQLKGKHIALAVATKNPFKILSNARRLQKIIKENKVDIVHARSRAPAWSVSVACKKTNAHFMTTFHGTHKISNPFKRWYNSVMVSGEVLIAVSNFIKNHIIENYKTDAKKIIVIQRGVDLQEFNPQVVPLGLGLPKGKKIVMLPGRITRWKGQKIFAEAMAEIDAIGVIVGDVGSPEYMREIEEILPDNVIILPGTSSLAEVLASADCVVTASTQPEAFGRIAIEAQALGKPVVATAIGGSLETVIDGKTGVLIKPNDALAMREAIKKILKSKINWQKNCSANAAKFSQEIMCDKTLEVYQSVLGIRD
jgi:glycosyltransferase involved in cell wall biosynthesis